jgi:hypothetical protein
MPDVTVRLTIDLEPFNLYFPLIAWRTIVQKSIGITQDPSSPNQRSFSVRQAMALRHKENKCISF